MRPTRQLIVSAIGVNVVLVQFARFGADGKDYARVLMALLAFVGVGNEVSEGVLLSGMIGVADGDRIRREIESGFGLAFVPNVGQANPSVFAVNQQPRLDKFFFPIFCRKCEALGQNGAYRKIKYCFVAILGMSSWRHPHEAIFTGIIGKQRRVEI